MDSFVIDRGAVESFHQKKTIVPNLLVIHFPPHVQSSLACCIVFLLLTMIVFREHVSIVVSWLWYFSVRRNIWNTGKTFQSVQSLTFWWIREATTKEVFDNGRISWLGSLTPNLTINNLSSLNIVHLEVKADNIRLREHFSFIAFTIVPKLPNKAILGQLRGDISFYLVSMVTLVTNISHKQPNDEKLTWREALPNYLGGNCSKPCWASLLPWKWIWVFGKSILGFYIYVYLYMGQILQDGENVCFMSNFF